MLTDDLKIRPQSNGSLEDYQALTQLHRYGYPEESVTPTGFKLADNARPPEFVCQRWFAEENGIICGVGSFEHWEAYFHKDKYLLHLIVAPDFQNRGIGAELYRTVISNLEERRPQLVRTWVQHDREKSLAFAEHRGFTRIKMKWNIRLELKSWSMEPFLEQAEAIRLAGVEIKSLAEISSDAEHLRKLYELYTMTLDSIEGADAAKIPSFDEFTEQIGQTSDDLFFIALDGDRYVGMWQLENESVTSLYGGIMAVAAEHRRRGTAFALAVRGIAQAKKFQYKTLAVHTNEHNKAILALTEKMGFTHLPAQILFSKQYQDSNL